MTRHTLLRLAGTLAGAALVPGLPVQATSAGLLGSALLDDWTVGAMWGVYPRYAESIAFGNKSGEPVKAADPVDTVWCK